MIAPTGRPLIPVALCSGLAALLFVAGCGGDEASPCEGAACDDTAAVDDTLASEDATADAGDTSEVYVPPLEKISTITFKLGGVNNVFDVGGTAFYVAGGDNAKTLKLSSNRGTRKIEINVLPVEPFAVGTWSDSVFSEVGVVICFNDGTGAVELPSCPVGFTHESIAYDLTITANNGVGSRIEGTFSATLKKSDDETLELTEGVFDLLHR